MHLVLSALVVSILIAAVAWTFVEPYWVHWFGIRAAERRRITEGRRPTPR